MIEDIEDLDVIVGSWPTPRLRWLLPVVGTIAMAAVLASSFAQLAPLAPLRPAVVRSVPAPARVLQNAAPATGFRSLELPRTIATVEARTQFSGVTGLTKTAQSDGFRDLYRLADGRLLVVIEYPDPANGAPATADGHAINVRGAKGSAYPTSSTSMPLAIGWAADGMQYQVGGAGFTADELLRFAEALR